MTKGWSSAQVPSKKEALILQSLPEVAFQALNRHGASSLREAAVLSEKEALQRKGIGKKVASELDQALLRIGLSFRPSSVSMGSVARQLFGDPSDMPIGILGLAADLNVTQLEMIGAKNLAEMTQVSLSSLVERRIAGSAFASQQRVTIITQQMTKLHLTWTE